MPWIKSITYKGVNYEDVRYLPAGATESTRKIARIDITASLHTTSTVSSSENRTYTHPISKRTVTAYKYTYNYYWYVTLLISNSMPIVNLTVSSGGKSYTFTPTSSTSWSSPWVYSYLTINNQNITESSNPVVNDHWKTYGGWTYPSSITITATTADGAIIWGTYNNGNINTAAKALCYQTLINTP